MDRLLILLPMVVAVILVVPDFRLPYLSDDFDFLNTAQTFRPGMLLPSPDVLFYRPLSREIYFSLLHVLGGTNPFLGHLLNMAVLAAAVFLLSLIASQLLDKRAGIVAGLLFAAFAQVPFLVGWVSGIQDLMAIALFLLAFHLQLRSKSGPAIAAFALALLAKETIVLLAPILMSVDWIRNGRTQPKKGPVIGYAVMIGAWLAIDPAMRTLGSHRGSAQGAYIGGYAGTAWDRLGPSVRSLVNLPPSGAWPPWPQDLSVAFALALGVLAVTLWLGARVRRPGKEDRALVPVPWVVAWAIYMAVVPTAATAVLVKQWNPYYLCIPTLGIALLGGMVLARMRWALTSALAAVWLTAGVWARGDVSMSPTVSYERNFAVTGEQLQTVERGFRRLHASLPPNSRVYVSVMGEGLGNVLSALQRYQCLRIWYENPTLRTSDPLNPLPGDGPEYLFVVRRDLAVDEVVLQQLPGNQLSIDVVRGAPSPSNLGVTLAVRNRAIGLFRAGEVDRAVQILVSLPIAAFHTFHWRLAAAFLLSQGRVADAQRLIAGSPMANFNEAAYDLLLYFAHVQGSALDDSAIRCFGVSLRDVATFRSLRDRLEQTGYIDGALRCARRVVALSPDDGEAMAALKRLEMTPQAERITRRADE